MMQEEGGGRAVLSPGCLHFREPVFGEGGCFEAKRQKMLLRLEAWQKPSKRGQQCKAGTAA